MKDKKKFDLKAYADYVSKLSQDQLSLPADIGNPFDERVDRLKSVFIKNPDIENITVERIDDTTSKLNTWQIFKELDENGDINHYSLTEPYPKGNHFGNGTQMSPDTDLVYEFEAKNYEDAYIVYEAFMKNDKKSHIQNTMKELLTFTSDEKKLNFETDILQLQIVNKILKVMDKNNISKNILAKKIGTSKGYLTQLFSGDRKFKLETLAKIQRALGIKFKINIEKVTYK